MCGIAGVMNADGSAPSAALLERLSDALGHRGPDGRGRHVSGGVGLVQTRLAIVDLETGDQPFFAETGRGDRAALVANGEIYNDLDLRRELKGTAFSSGSDCEPPLHLYLAHGEDFARRLRGMYALAIHDPAAKRLVLARDPFGIKPLYYMETATRFAFASEPQALFKAGLAEPKLRVRGRDEVLQAQFTMGSETIFEGVMRVPPGQTLVVEDGKVVRRILYQALPDGGPVSLSMAEALKSLDRHLNDTVGVHQRADVPYGMFLSGGVDSSVLLAMMDRLNERPVQAFTMGFEGGDVHDERDHARGLAKATGAQHVDVSFGEDDFWRLLPRVAEAMDDPAADYACLPTYKLAATVRDAGLKVILSGEGGDEMFGGYGRYRRAMRPRFLGGRPMRAKGVFDGLGILRGGEGWREAIMTAETQAARPGRSRLQAVQAADCVDWLPNDLLTKLDRCLMVHGVEGRVPFLDVKFAAFAFSLPDSFKIRRNLGKWVLRKWLSTGLPDANAFSRKRGFTVPVGAWIAGKGRELGKLVAAQPGVREACRPGTVEALFASLAGGRESRAGMAAWNLLFYALWHRSHILGLEKGGDAFETLAEKS
ncbi:MAG TPA: asparagine synthase (glutamine-hydrolyzing) [Rhodospirillales bacterium]|nr:asparagine synthase (glutamine-hydrolyzing) [Rhodospirillales bacterium]